MSFYVYMIKSITVGTKKTYVGYSNDVETRLEKHNNNKGAKSTKGYKWKLIYKKKFKSKNKALSFEYKLEKNKLKRAEILSKSK